MRYRKERKTDFVDIQPTLRGETTCLSTLSGNDYFFFCIGALIDPHLSASIPGTLLLICPATDNISSSFRHGERSFKALSRKRHRAKSRYNKTCPLRILAV
jgi:hypothetical protein